MDLPETWTHAKMPDVVEWSSGGTPKSDNQKYYNGDIPWLIIGDLTDAVVYSSATNITELGLKESSTKYVEEGSVLLGMYGSIGKLGIAGVKLTTNQAIAFTKTLNGIHNWYLFYYLQLIKSKLYSLSKGGTQKNISLTVINFLAIPLPPLPEQRRIVAKIDSLFSELDNGVAFLKTIKTQLAIYRQAVLKWAFEGKLTNSIMQKEKRLEDMCFFITKGTTPKKNEMTSQKGDIPFIKVYNLTFNGILDFTIEPTYVSRTVHDNFLERSKVVAGDVLMNIVGPPLGKVSMIPDSMNEANINQAIARFRCKELLDNKYLAYYLLNKRTIEGLSKQAKTTAGQINLTLEICRNLIIPYCPKPEQLAIVSAIESRLSVCDKLEQTIDQTLALSASLRQSILKKAFEGRLVSQDPNDEPAEKLLERIKAEKAVVLAKQKQARKRGRR